MEKDIQKYEDIIRKYSSSYDYEEALNCINKTKLINKEDDGYNHFYTFNVENDFLYKTFSNFTVNIGTFNGEVTKFKCNCSHFFYYGTCKHITSSMMRYGDLIFKSEKFDDNIVAKDMLSIFSEDNEEVKTVVKKKIDLDIELYISTGDGDINHEFKFKIGTDKKYLLNKKLVDFSNAYYYNDSNVVFGKNFTYNQQNYFFDDTDDDIINFILSKDKNYFVNMSRLNFSKALIRFSKKKIHVFAYDNDIGIYEGTTSESPFEIYISKQDNKYLIKFTNLDKLLYIGQGPMFVPYKGKFSIVGQDVIALINKLIMYKRNYLLINKDEFGILKDKLLPKIKEEITIDESLNGEIIIGKKPKVKLYFDSKNDGIICNLILKYADSEINYFDENNNVVRDIEFENEVVNDLKSYNFIIDNKRFVMSDLDYIGDFLENDIDSLTKNYEVYSTENFKKNKIIKTSLKSTFSIGQDSILSYSFDLDGISNKEVNDMLDSLKKKKKYYKLKNGSIVNLQDDNNLNELNNLIDDMDIDKVNDGVIPKYRAIYLSSLKDNKYSIIETNNLFDDFITRFEENKNGNIPLSQKELSVLRDYQVTGVKWLYNIYKCELGGILADEMGLGKSIQLIYLIKSILKEKKDAKILIVCPTALVYNWEKEFEKFGDGISYKVMYGNKDKRHDNLNNIKENVIITSYGLVREDIEYYKNISFEVMAIDEAQTIKNIVAGITKCTKSINAKVKFALTGTPLENSILELWSIFDFIMPGYLTNTKKFNEKYQIKDFDDESKNKLSGLKKQIDPFILRRKKMDVLKDLPDKIENNIYIDLNEKQKNIYAMEVKKTREEMDELIITEGYDKARFKILSLITRLRQLCIDPKLVYDNYASESSKVIEVIKLCKDIISNGHKILLFSSFKGAIDILNREFTNESISTYVIDGSVGAKKRNELVEKFNNDDTNIFLITIKSGGVGLNLTSADVVIHLDLWWNPQVENQATDRAHRIGQKNTVEVIKLICKGTIEEKILELQNKKKMLSDTLIEGENRDQNIINNLSIDDIKNLLSYDNDEE